MVIMKKFFSLILTLAIFIPALQVSAADIFIPNFSDIVSNRFQKRIEFVNRENKNLNGVEYTMWVYRCLDGKENEYINRYIQQLSGKYDIQIIGKENNVNKKSWYFLYTGTQSNNLKLLNNTFHIHVDGSHPLA